MSEQKFQIGQEVYAEDRQLYFILGFHEIPGREGLYTAGPCKGGLVELFSEYDLWSMEESKK